MDSISEAFHMSGFKVAFIEKKGEEFQRWFAELAGHAWGSDFQSVRPYGSQGDWKCDGRRISTGTIFQCYAPDSMTDRKMIEKIDADLDGAVENWPDFIKEWVLVHNDDRGIAPTVAAHLDSKKKAYPNVSIQLWTKPNLLELFSKLSAHAKLSMFGPVPRHDTGYSLQDLHPVISALESRDPIQTVDMPLPPSAEKLDKNDLSADARELLKFGRRRVRLVETYFAKNVEVELGERFAEAFRQRYAELRSLELTSDQIFDHLCNFVGISGEPARRSAATAVLLYFFDRCDIFEDPDDREVEAS